MAARGSYISGVAGLGELTAAVQSCVSLWEGGLVLADVKGRDMLTRRALAQTAHALALRGEAVFLIRDRLIPASDWDVVTRDGEPRSYRLGVRGWRAKVGNRTGARGAALPDWFRRVHALGG